MLNYGGRYSEPPPKSFLTIKSHLMQKFESKQNLSTKSLKCMWKVCMEGAESMVNLPGESKLTNKATKLNQKSYPMWKFDKT